jgi:hypothetical protein
MLTNKKSAHDSVCRHNEISTVKAQLMDPKEANYKPGGNPVDQHDLPS